MRPREAEKAKAAAVEKPTSPAQKGGRGETQGPPPPAAPPPQQFARESKKVEKEPREEWTTLVETARIPGGVFTMGNDAGRKDEKPAHQVRLNSFPMSRTEITNRQYRTFLEQTGHARPKVQS